MRHIELCILILLMTATTCSQSIGREHDVNMDGIVVSDPNWGREEIKKIQRCLRLPLSFRQKDMGPAVIGISFTIDKKGDISSITANKYNKDLDFKLSKQLFRETQLAIIRAIRESKIRPIDAPGPSLCRVSYIMTAARQQMEPVYDSRYGQK